MSNQDSNRIDVDPELINDFLGEFADAYDELQRSLVLVDQRPDDPALINQLFRTVHSIKSNLRMMGLDRLSEIVHLLENIIDDIRHQRLRYFQGINDILLLAINQVKGLSVRMLHDEDVQGEVDRLTAAVQVPCMVEPAHLPSAISRVLSQIDPDQYPVFQDSTVAGEPAVVSAGEVVPASAGDVAVSSDMAYFRDLVAQMEQVMPYWQGRNQRLLELCLAMNELAGSPVDVHQLTAAVYLHDIGMVFVPHGIVSKSESLTAEEIAILRGHCRTGYEWLSRISGWEQAADMVHQHHERMDGNGYPQGLAGEAIGAGARIIAIADTFEAMTSSRAWREHKRPVMRALLEINSSAGQQFDVEWVRIFNEVIKNRGGMKEGRAASDAGAP